MKRTILYCCFMVLAAFGLLRALPAYAAADYFKPIHIQGIVEVCMAGETVWRPLLESATLLPGSRVRAAKDSFAEFSFAYDLSELARLDSDSQITVLGPGVFGVNLESGSFCMLREKDEADKTATKRDIGSFEVRFRGSKVRAERGGFCVTLLDGGSKVRVFGDKVWIIRYSAAGAGVDPKAQVTPLAEGFKCFLSAKSPEGAEASIERMVFEDYADWQEWARRCYERKDDRASNLLEKQGIAR